jgi:hypothetical protein
VDIEVPLSRFGQRRIHELDEHHVIDVCGVGERFVRPRGIPDEGVDPRRLEVRQNVLRGVEVKVSRGDFRNGFFCTGCNYNYLLTPMRLVSPGSLPPGVGLIEYNRFKFSAELREEGLFGLRGLRVVKRHQLHDQEEEREQARGDSLGAHRGAPGERIQASLGPMRGFLKPPGQQI